MKRNTHSYKIADKWYKKAVRRAKKEKTTVANVIEDYLMLYSQSAETHTLPLPSDYMVFGSIGTVDANGVVNPLLPHNKQ